MVASLSVVTTGGGVSNQRLLKTMAGGGGRERYSKVMLVSQQKGKSLFAAFISLRYVEIRDTNV